MITEKQVDAAIDAWYKRLPEKLRVKPTPSALRNVMREALEAAEAAKEE